MPATRFERLLAAAGLAAVCALAALTVLAWLEYAEAEPELVARSAAPEGVVQVRSARAVEDVRPPDEARTPAVRPVAAPAAMHLELTAARGECWLQVRLGSSEGELVYAGILEQGQSRTFTARRLWIELGAPHTLDAVLDGKPVANLPAGTATVTATRDGIELAGTA